MKLKLLWVFCTTLMLWTQAPNIFGLGSIDVHEADGVIDLRAEKFTGDYVYINGYRWKFYRNQLLFPYETASSQYELVPVPSSWHLSTSMPANGWATYQADIYLPENHAQYVIYFPAIASALKVWIDTTLVAEKGIVSHDPAVHRGSSLSTIVNIPDHVKKITLTLQVSNYSFHYAGILAAPRIAKRDVLHRKLSNHNAWGNLFAGSLIAVAIIHMFLFGLFPREKAYLFLAFICICVAIRTFVFGKGTLFFQHMFPAADMEVFKRMEYFAVYFMMILFPWYVYASFKRRSPFAPVLIFTSLGVLFCGATLVAPVSFYAGALLDIAHLIFFTEFIFAGYVFYKNRARSDKRIILAGIVVSSPLIMLEMLNNSGVIYFPFSHTLELGVLLFFLFQSFLLARKNAQAFHAAENLNRTLEFQVNERTRELTESNQVKDSLLSIISHDLKSPVNSLRSVLQLFNKGHINETELRQLMATIERDVNSTYLLMDNILKWSASHADSIWIQLKRLNLRTLVDEQLQFFLQQSGLKNVKLNNVVEPGLLVKADENVVSLVLRNLISNAIKFTPSQGIVEVSAKTRGDHVELMVKDNGVGMDEETAGNIFREFLPSQPGTQSEKGHGLGLSLCRRFLTRMGANIHVQSTPRKGTTFTVFLEPFVEPVAETV